MYGTDVLLSLRSIHQELRAREAFEVDRYRRRFPNHCNVIKTLICAMVVIHS